MKSKYTRKDLIEICENGVVPVQNWNDRDSCSAQRQLESIYGALSAGVKYSYTIEGNTIIINFEKPTPEQLNNFTYLNVGSRDEYLEWYIEENGDEYIPEMFEGYGIDWKSGYLGGYLPTKERLKECGNSDWY